MPVSTPAQLPAHLRSLRKARRLTQAQLGALVGLDQTRIAKIEQEPLRVSVGQLMKILAALRVRLQLEPLSEKSRAAAKEPPADW